MFDQVLWFATRGAGAVSLMMLTASVCFGMVVVTRFQHAEWPRFFNYEMHRRISLLSIVFLAVHILAAVFDPFTSLGLGAALVPLASTYRPIPVALGVVALYLFVALIATSLLRKHIGQKTWRAVHWASYAMWPLAVLHGLTAGTDGIRDMDAGPRRRMRRCGRGLPRMAAPSTCDDDRHAGHAPAERPAEADPMRVLVAEDDEGLREVLVLGLSDAGYHVDAVDRGDDAIDQLKWYDYDVAVVDWRMPGAEGIDVVAWARRNERPTAILMLTARDTPADRIRGLDTGADDYLVKPFDFGELLARVRALQRRPRGVDAPVLQVGPPDARSRHPPGGGRRARSVADRHRVPHPRAAPAAVAGRRRPKGDRRACLGRRDRSDRLERHRRPAEPAPGQAHRGGRADRHGAWRGVPAGSRVTMAHVPAVRRQSIRVALVATGVVAVVYLAVAIVVVAFTTRTLTPRSTGAWPIPCIGFRRPTAARLTRRSTRGATRPSVRGAGARLDGPAGRDRPRQRRRRPTCPPTSTQVTDPVSATIDGTEMRVAGGDGRAQAHVVVAQAMDDRRRTRSGRSSWGSC